LLHDVFDMEYSEVAQALERSEPACRQLAARAREHVRSDRPRHAPSESEARKLADAFAAAAATGDIDGLARTLADDATLYADGGSKRRAGLKPIVGKEKILRLYRSVAARGAAVVLHAEAVTLNGLPGFVMETSEGAETVALQISNGLITAIYSVRNPDKLQHLGSSPERARFSV
jgi:RNA polymerase sigma-70 factor (ECF subfamily)